MNYIYTLKNPVTGEIKYVGKTNNIKLRYRKHIEESKRGNKSHKNNWIRQMLSKNIKPEIEILDSTNDKIKYENT